MWIVPLHHSLFLKFSEFPMTFSYILNSPFFLTLYTKLPDNITRLIFKHGHKLVEAFFDFWWFLHFLPTRRFSIIYRKLSSKMRWHLKQTSIVNRNLSRGSYQKWCRNVFFNPSRLLQTSQQPILTGPSHSTFSPLKLNVFLRIILNLVLIF